MLLTWRSWKDAIGKGGKVFAENSEKTAHHLSSYVAADISHLRHVLRSTTTVFATGNRDESEIIIYFLSAQVVCTYPTRW